MKVTKPTLTRNDIQEVLRVYQDARRSISDALKYMPRPQRLQIVASKDGLATYCAFAEHYRWLCASRARLTEIIEGRDSILDVKAYKLCRYHLHDAAGDEVLPNTARIDIGNAVDYIDNAILLCKGLGAFRVLYPDCRCAFSTEGNAEFERVGFSTFGDDDDVLVLTHYDECDYHRTKPEVLFGKEEHIDKLTRNREHEAQNERNKAARERKQAKAKARQNGTGSKSRAKR